MVEFPPATRRARGRHGVAAVVMLSRYLGHGCAAVVCGQPLRTGARSCPRAIIAMICHGGAIGPSLRTMAAAAVARADMASASAEPAGTIAGSTGSTCGPRWCLGRAATRRELLPAGSSRAPCRRVRPGRRRLCGGSVHRRWPAALVRRRRSRRRDAGVPARVAARGSPCSWRSGPVAVVATRVHHQSSAANGAGRSPSVAAAQSSRDISAPSLQDLPAPGRAPRSRLAPSRIGPSCQLVHRPGRGEWCCILRPPTGETQATGPPGSKAPERLETALITQLTLWTPRGHGSRPVSHRHQL